MDQVEHVDAAEVRQPQEQPEERRFTLEVERLRLERQKAALEVRLKRQELNATRKKGWVDFLGNPLILAIVGGFITLMTTIVTSHVSRVDSIDAEIAKARQSLQTDLIKKFIESPDRPTIRTNLRFLVDVGLVPDYADRLRAFLSKNPDFALPSTFTPGASALQDVHTDDDAIDLLVRFEGDYFDDPRYPGGATKFGITLDDLSRYLGRTASKDDLRNLSIETARDIYKNEYLKGGPSGLTSVWVKAAYLNLATLMGRARATRFFKAAASKLAATPLPDDGVLDLLTLRLINAEDPDLLIETANCEAAKFDEALPTFSTFGPAWLRRLRAFSQATLKGVCPELQPSPNPPAAAPGKP